VRYPRRRGPRNPNALPRHEDNGAYHDEPVEEEVLETDDPAKPRPVLHLNELKRMPPRELLALAEELGVEGTARSRKQDVIFSILKAKARQGFDVATDGVLDLKSRNTKK
jgi:transcription termination factor Rho